MAGYRQTLTTAIGQLRAAGGSLESPHVDAVRPTRAVWPTARPRAPRLYHETITTACVLLINERIDRTATQDWPAFAAAHADLLTWKPSVLDRYYTPERLWSERARQTFLMPDRVRR
jgi:hypothetical protein